MPRGRIKFTPRPPVRKPKEPSRLTYYGPYSPSAPRPITATRGGRTAAYAAKATYTQPEPEPKAKPMYYGPYSPTPTLNTQQLENMQKAYLAQQANRQAAGVGVGGTFSGHKEAQGMWPDLSQNTISRWARRLRQGYRWRYLEDYPQYEEPLTQEPSGGGYGYGGYGYGGYGYPAGGGYTAAEPEPPKQYGSVRTSGERNLPQWLMDMVVWSI